MDTGREAVGSAERKIRGRGGVVMVMVMVMVSVLKRLGTERGVGA
jgi:hypothetical protein